jgi:dipeptidase
MKKIITVFIFLTAIVSIAAGDTQRECFLLMVGKDASSSGKILLAHNNDLTGTEASMLIKVPAGESVFNLPDNENEFKESYELLVLQIHKGFAEGDAVAINEHGVVIAGGLSLKRDRSEFAEKTDPLIKEGLGGGIRFYALSHAKTARECVEIIGKCFDKYGVAYPSGVGIADSNEIWYLEAGGGKSWAAVRIPDSSYFVAANSYRIGDIDFEDKENFIYSSNLPELYRKYITRNNKDKKFNFAKFFGGGVKEKEGNNYYNSRRLWRAIDLLSPGLKIADTSQDFPMFLRPDKKIGLQTCFSLLRDYYQDTKYNVLDPANRQKPERSIAVWRTVHSEVIEITPGENIDYGTILWAALSSPFVSIFTPFYFGISEIPSAYSFAPEKYNAKSAFWQFYKLGSLLKNDFSELIPKWNDARMNFETEVIAQQPGINAMAHRYVKNKADLRSYLNLVTSQYAKLALEAADKMIEELEKQK